MSPTLTPAVTASVTVKVVVCDTWIVPLIRPVPLAMVKPPGKPLAAKLRGWPLPPVVWIGKLIVCHCCYFGSQG